MSTPDQQYCVEVIARSSSSNKLIKRTFAVETYMDRQKLLGVLNAQAKSTKTSLAQSIGVVACDLIRYMYF